MAKIALVASRDSVSTNAVRSSYPHVVVRRVNHAAEITRLMAECAELREALGREIEERTREIARHQMALMEERLALTKVKQKFA
jgi:hypothetical protein